MFRPKDGHGFGNILMQLCHVNIVSEKIYESIRKDYIKVNMCVLDDKTSDIEIIDCPPLNIIPHLHKNIKYLIEPTLKLKKLINEYYNLVNGVGFAFQIRRCGFAKDFNEHSPNFNYCTDQTLEKFFYILENTTCDVYVTSDCLETKRLFKSRFPDRVRILDEKTTHTANEINEYTWVPFLEFFLLGMCPYVYITGGNPDMSSFSTFGYMACMYNHTKFIPIFN